MLAALALVLAFVLEVSLFPDAFPFVRGIAQLMTGTAPEQSWELLQS